MHIDLIHLDFIDLNLRKMGVSLEEETGVELIITSLYRMTGKGVHTTLPLRGIDYRMRNMEIGNMMAKIVNDEWQYDYKRPSLKCAIAHGTGTGFHLHTQTHPNTRRRYKSLES